MAKFKESIKQYWYRYLIGILLGLQALVFIIFRDESYLQIHDNLDLFMAHYQMMKLNHGWYAHNVTMPMLHGIDRDLLGSEFLLYNVLYIIFPNIVAYFIGYALKIIIGIWSFNLLFKEILSEKYDKYRPIVLVCAAAFGLIPVFPTYGIAFTSVPLIVYYLVRVYREPGILELRKEHSPSKNIWMRVILYLAVFCYPIFSYFSYHGFFILCYMCVAVIILWIRDKKFPLKNFVSICILALGYVCFEYRLFKAMLFDDTVTIRTTMEHGTLSFGESMKEALNEFLFPTFHNADSHVYVVLGVVVIGLIIINVNHFRHHEAKKCLTEPANLVMLWMIFNVVIFGLYQNEGFRTFVETLVPKLTGFEFARTSYFNTFLWYAELLLICMKLYDLKGKYGRILANIVVTAAVLVVMFVPQVYNDFYYTVYNQAYKLILHKDTSTVNYREFYSTDLFDEVKADIGYSGEWAAAYGMHPAVLQYNGISTLDGYLGMYPEEYKQQWIKVEEPAFEGSPSLSAYFEGWGARVSLYSGSDENTYAPLRNISLSDERLMADLNELKKLDCKYIFSRIRFSNEDEIAISLVGSYENDSSPYTIYVYELD